MVAPVTSTPAQPEDDDVGRPAPTFYRFLSPLMRGLLRSPLRRLLSGQLMLLEYLGAISGRRYTIPIGYFAWDDGSVLSFSGSRWWRNLRDGRQVSLLLGSVRRAAVPTVIGPIDSRATLLGEFVHRYGPRTAGRLQVGLPSDRQPTPDELRAAAARKMLIRFDPADGKPLVEPA